MRLQLPGKWGGKKRLSGGEKSNATQIQGLQEMYKATAKELEKRLANRILEFERVYNNCIF